MRRQEELRRRVGEVERKWKEGQRLESAGEVGRLEQGGKAIEAKLREEKVVVEEKKASQTEKEDPWKRVRGGPSESWQPAAWSGAAVKRGG